jgi:hypothetical protein
MKRKCKKGYPMTERRWEQLCEHLVEALKGDSTQPETHDPQYMVWECDQTMKHTLKWMQDYKIRDIPKEIKVLHKYRFAKCDCTVWLNMDRTIKELVHSMQQIAETRAECNCCGEEESFFTPIDHLSPEELATYKPID